MAEMQILQEQKSVHPHYRDFFATTASADFSITLMLEISPGKVPKLSARAAKLYLMCPSVTVGFCICSHTHRPHPASLLVRVPTVVHLLSASFRLTSRFPPCVFATVVVTTSGYLLSDNEF